MSPEPMARIRNKELHRNIRIRRPTHTNPTLLFLDKHQNWQASTPTSISRLVDPRMQNLCNRNLCQMTGDEIIQSLNSDLEIGLTVTEALTRLHSHGLNKFEIEEKVHSLCPPLSLTPILLVPHSLPPSYLLSSPPLHAILLSTNSFSLPLLSSPLL